MSSPMTIEADLGAIRHHMLSVLVENRPGVLARVVNLFSRRGYNIFSLAVAPTEDERFSRITIVVDLQSSPLEQIMKQTDKLVNVVEITELDPRTAVERELLLAIVSADDDTRAKVEELTSSFGGRVLDLGAREITVSLDGDPNTLDDYEERLRPFGIVELQRTGRVALPKLPTAQASA